jgi:hypothetical protein
MSKTRDLAVEVGDDRNSCDAVPNRPHRVNVVTELLPDNK